MSARPFTVHVDPDDLARQDLAAALPSDPAPAPEPAVPPRRRQRGTTSRQDRTSGRSRGAATAARSYPFRRS
jgi:hypothetical protein